MKLLPEQVESLRLSLDKLVETYISLLDSKKSESRNVNYSNDGFTDSSNIDIAYEINATINKIHELESVLASCTVVSEVNSDVIEVGSEFTATIDFFGEKETQTYHLSENAEHVEGKVIISTKSPLGQAAMGKRENDEFSYQVNDNIFTGVIDKVNSLSNAPKEKTIEK